MIALCWRALVGTSCLHSFPILIIINDEMNKLTWLSFFYSKVTNWLIRLLLNVRHGFFLQKLSPIFQEHRVLFEYFGCLASYRLDHSLKEVSAKHSPSEDNVIIMFQLRTIVRFDQMDDSIIGLDLHIVLNEGQIYCYKADASVGVRFRLWHLKDVSDVFEFAH